MNQFTSAFVAAVIIISISTKTLSAPSPQLIPSLSFKDSTIAVDFLGFHAGLGSNNMSYGEGFHVEAGTPFGQKAAVGLNGAIENGQLGGQLYAGATVGGNIKAAAGLGGAIGIVGDIKANGGLYSAALAGSNKFGASMTGGINQNGPFGSSYSVPDKGAINNPSSNSTENYLNIFFAAPESITNSSGTQLQKSYVENLLANPISSLGMLSRFLGK